MLGVLAVPVPAHSHGPDGLSDHANGHANDHAHLAGTPRRCGWSAAFPGTTGTMGFTITPGIGAMPTNLVVRTTTPVPAQLSTAVNDAITTLNAAAGSAWRRGADVTPHPDLSTASRTHRPPPGELWIITTPGRFPRLPVGNYAHYHVETPPGGLPQATQPMVVLTEALIHQRTPHTQTSTLLHEFGHIAGLDHHFEPWQGQCQLMSYGGPRVLGTGDTAGLRLLAGRSPFVDVEDNRYFTEATRWAFTAGIVTGLRNTPRFAPTRNVTRAEAVTMLWRAAGSPPPPVTAPHFSDVPPHVWFADAVRWAAHHGIVTGLGGPHLFSPLHPATRAQLVTMQWRLAQRPATPGGPPRFGDVGAHHWSAPAVAWAAHTGVTTGAGSPDRFGPNRQVTRAEAVTMVWRAR